MSVDAAFRAKRADIERALESVIIDVVNITDRNGLRLNADMRPFIEEFCKVMDGIQAEIESDERKYVLKPGNREG